MTDYLKFMTDRYPALEGVSGDVKEAFEILKTSYENGGKLLVCGNGGSASDSEHIVGELMKGFYKKRPLPETEKEAIGEISAFLQGALPAIALTGHPALTTAFSNDVRADMTFAQQVYGYGKAGDVLIALSTSGNSVNVLHAATVAKAENLAVIGLTGQDGGRLREICDVCIAVPARVTAEIQEYHLPVYHTLCAMLEDYFFPDQDYATERTGTGEWM